MRDRTAVRLREKRRRRDEGWRGALSRRTIRKAASEASEQARDGARCGRAGVWGRARPAEGRAVQMS